MASFSLVAVACGVAAPQARVPSSAAASSTGRPASARVEPSSVRPLVDGVRSEPIAGQPPFIDAPLECATGGCSTLSESQPVYGMCGMYALGFGTTAGEINGRAMELFEAAEASYSAGRYRDAAQGFRSAAEALLDGRDLPQAAALERNRRIAYANMVVSWVTVDAVQTAREALERLAAADPALAAELRRIAARLPSLPSCDL